MTPGPAAHGRFSRRKVAAVLAGLVCTSAVMTLSLGEVLVATGHPAMAAALPGDAALVARAAMGADIGAGRPGSAGQLALDALRTSPVNQSAIIVVAADHTRPTLSEANRASLVQDAARQGWRDGFAQQTLYNVAMARGDCPQAMLHAAALMRGGIQTDALGANLVLAVTKPDCRRALTRRIADGDPWAKRWLLLHRAVLDPTVLADLQGGLPPLVPAHHVS